MPMHLSSLSSLMEAMERVLAEHGVDAGPVLARAGLLAPVDPDSRLDQKRTRLVWREAAAATKSPCIGFEMGQAIVPANLHAVGFAWISSRTLKEGLERLARYDRMLTTVLDVVVRPAGDRLEVKIESSGHGPREGLDAAFCVIVGMCRTMTDAEFKPLAVEMSREKPPCAAALARYFACPVTYGAGSDTLWLDLEHATQVLPRQNPAVAQANDEVARTYLARFDRDNVLSRAHTELVTMLPHGTPSRGELARALHMSERTLHRRLDKEGTSFREIVDEVRRELALGYVGQRRYSLIEIGFLLGFTDPSNFARAFKRWTGSAPSRFRETQQKPATPSKKE